MTENDIAALRSRIDQLERENAAYSNAHLILLGERDAAREKCEQLREQLAGTVMESTELRLLRALVPQLREKLAAVTAERDAARERITALEADRNALMFHDMEAGQYVESVIAMRTHFTGEPPYVGWKGLGLALTEKLDALEAKCALHAASEKQLDEMYERLEAANKDLAEVLFRFREHVQRFATQWFEGGGSHHHPIWLQVATALEPYCDPTGGNVAAADGQQQQAAKLCNNCDTALPLGCEGQFAAEKECEWKANGGEADKS